MQQLLRNHPANDPLDTGFHTFTVVTAKKGAGLGFGGKKMKTKKIFWEEKFYRMAKWALPSWVFPSNAAKLMYLEMENGTYAVLE